MINLPDEVPEEIQDLFDKCPMAMIVGGLLLYSLMVDRGRPKWLGSCPPIHGRRNGAWRGKGSFGHGFGANKVRHK